MLTVAKAKPDDFSVMGDPAYAAAWSKLVDLQEQLKELEAEYRQARSRPKEIVDGVTEAARRLLSGGGVAAADEKVRDYQGEIAVLERAIGMQREVVEGERQRVSTSICERNLPQHRELVRSVAEALVGLGKAIDAEIEFRQRLEYGNVRFAADLVPVTVNQSFVSPRYVRSQISQWLRAALDRRLIDPAIVPKEWQRLWTATGGWSPPTIGGGN